MDIRIKATKMELSPSLKDYVELKMNKLLKYLGDTPVNNCDVELERSLTAQTKGKLYRAEVNLSLGREMLRVEKTEKTIIKAIDKVKDHLVLMIKKTKEKKLDQARGR